MALWRSALVFLFLASVEIFVTFANEGSAHTTTSVSGCTDNGNFTACNNVGKTSFFTSLFKTSIHGLEGADTSLNLLYLTFTGTLLVVAILEAVARWIPFLNGN